MTTERDPLREALAKALGNYYTDPATRVPGMPPMHYGAAQCVIEVLDAAAPASPALDVERLGESLSAALGWSPTHAWQQAQRIAAAYARLGETKPPEPCSIEPAFSQHEYAVDYCETHDQPAASCLGETKP